MIKNNQTESIETVTMPFGSVSHEEIAPEIKYFSAKTKGFYSSYIHDKMPDDCVIVTEKEYNDIFEGQHAGKELSIDIEGKPRATDRVETPEQAATMLKDEAQQLLKNNDFRWSNKIKWDNYTEEQKANVTAYYNALVAVVNGESTTIPTLITDRGDN